MVLEVEVVLIVLAVGWIVSGLGRGSSHWLTRLHMVDADQRRPSPTGWASGRRRPS